MTIINGLCFDGRKETGFVYYYNQELCIHTAKYKGHTKKKRFYVEE